MAYIRRSTSEKAMAKPKIQDFGVLPGEHDGADLVGDGAEGIAGPDHRHFAAGIRRLWRSGSTCPSPDSGFLRRAR